MFSLFHDAKVHFFSIQQSTLFNFFILDREKNEAINSKKTPSNEQLTNSN
jgi:hypothetical protein